MATPQGFPSPDTPLIDPVSGGLSLIWFRFLAVLWTRSGGAIGNNSASFNYPNTSGNVGQVLTSEGAARPSIWTTLATKLSQFANDVGFITSDALVGLSTPASVNQQITNFALTNFADTVPAPDTTTGFAGTSTRTSRGDHSHPREANPIFAGTVVANRFVSHGASWTGGTGVPTGAQPAGSLFSRIDGSPGSLLYVSNGVGWLPVA